MMVCAVFCTISFLVIVKSIYKTSKKCLKTIDKDLISIEYFFYCQKIEGRDFLTLKVSMFGQGLMFSHLGSGLGVRVSSRVRFRVKFGVILSGLMKFIMLMRSYKKLLDA